MSLPAFPLHFGYDAGQKQTQLLALLSAAASETAADAAHGPFVAAPSREDWTRVASSIDGITSSGEEDRWARLLGEDQDSVASRRDTLEGLWKCVCNSGCWLMLECCMPHCRFIDYLFNVRTVLHPTHHTFEASDMLRAHAEETGRPQVAVPAAVIKV